MSKDGSMTVDEMVRRAKVVVKQEVGREFWFDLAKNKSCDYESCYLCGCDIDSMFDGNDHHEDWCPTVIARRVLGLRVNREPKPEPPQE